MKFTMYAQRVFSFKWTETVAFYKDKVGLPLKFEDEQLGWAEFDLGGVSLAIERQEPDDKEAKTLVGRLIGISIQVDDIHSVYKELSDRGVSFVGPPEKQPWGGILAHFNDPDGNTLTLLDSANT